MTPQRHGRSVALARTNTRYVLEYNLLFGVDVGVIYYNYYIIMLYCIIYSNDPLKAFYVQCIFNIYFQHLGVFEAPDVVGSDAKQLHLFPVMRMEV